MPLKYPFEIMKQWDPELDMDELECMISHLITMNFVKGYLSHEKKILIMMQDIEKAFP